MKRCLGRFFGLYCVALLLVCANARAEEVKLRHDDVTLNASLALAHGKSLSDGVILMTHGTLAHNKMEIIATLQALFLEHDRSSLAINLSLGVDDRQGAYDCESPHTHQHTDALDEIDAWLSWLKQQGVEEVVLLGHSRGGNQTAWFISERNDPVIKATVLVAPMTWDKERVAATYTERAGDPLAPILETAQAHVAGKQPEEQLEHTSFLFCTDATVSAASFVSYYAADPRLDTPHLLDELDTPVLVIAGSEDTVVPDLDTRLAPLAEKGKVDLFVIEGADHFFRDLNADELVEAVVEYLDNH